MVQRFANFQDQILDKLEELAVKIDHGQAFIISASETIDQSRFGDVELVIEMRLILPGHRAPTVERDITGQLHVV